MDTFLRTLSTLQLTSGESISRHVSVQMVDILNTFCEQTHANNLHFHVFLVQLASAHGVRCLLCWCLMVDRPILLNCKALSLLRTVNEQKVFSQSWGRYDTYCRQHTAAHHVHSHLNFRHSINMFGSYCMYQNLSSMSLLPWSDASMQNTHTHKIMHFYSGMTVFKNANTKNTNKLLTKNPIYILSIVITNKQGNMDTGILSASYSMLLLR